MAPTIHTPPSRHRGTGASGSLAPDAGPLNWCDWYQIALVLRQWGLVCIPLDGNKKPIGRWKAFQTRKPTDAQLGRLFAYNPRVRGVGVLLGRGSSYRGRGLVVRDFDTYDGYLAWAHANPEVAATCPTVRTRRGAHVYFWNPGPDVFLDHRAGLPFGAGDIRGDRRHYAVLPPSAHPHGGTYRWMRNEPKGPDNIPVFTLTAAGVVAQTPRLPAARTTPSARLYAPSRRTTKRPATAAGQLAPAIREVVLRSLPTGPGERHRRLFDLAQRLKDIAPGATASFWAGAFSEWWRLAALVVRSQDRGASWREFVDALDRVRVPTSFTAPRLAIFPYKDADKGPENPNTSCVHSERDRLILAACSRLAALSRDGVFFLSYRLAGEACGLRSHVQAGKRLRGLVAAGCLIVVGKREQPSASRRRATRYRLGCPAVRG